MASSTMGALFVLRNRRVLGKVTHAGLAGSGDAWNCTFKEFFYLAGSIFSLAIGYFWLAEAAENFRRACERM